MVNLFSQLLRYHVAPIQLRLRYREQATEYQFPRLLRAHQPDLPFSLGWSAVRRSTSEHCIIDEEEQLHRTDTREKARTHAFTSPTIGFAGYASRNIPRTTNSLPQASVLDSSLGDGRGLRDEPQTRPGIEHSTKYHSGVANTPAETRQDIIVPNVSTQDTQKCQHKAWHARMRRQKRLAHGTEVKWATVIGSGKRARRRRSSVRPSQVFIQTSRNSNRYVRNGNNIHTSSPGLIHVSLKAYGQIKDTRGELRASRSGSRLHIFHPTWSTAFARVNAPYRRTYLASKSGVPAFIFRFRRFIPDYHVLSLENKLEGSIARAWSLRSFRGKKAYWQHALLFALQKSLPDAMIIMKDIIHRKSLQIPGYVLKDVLDHIASVSLGTRSSRSKPDLDCFLHTAHQYLGTYSKLTGSASLSQRTLWLLSRCCSADQLKDLIHQLDASNADFHTYSRLQMMYRFAVLDRLGLAIELLGTIPEEDVSLDGVQSLCVFILRAKWDTENLYKLRNHLLNHMLELGVRPNRRLHDVILLNAMEAGDRETAWKSFQITLDNGLAPTAFTYSILLKGVEHGDDLSTIDFIYQRSRDERILLSNPFLATHLVYSVYIFNKAHEKETFDSMLAIFQELFDSTPLQELGILDLPKGSVPIGGGPMRPPVAALGCMLVAWLEENYANTAKVHEVYEHFLSNVKAQHPRLAALAENTITFNAFIKAFGRHRDSLHLCTNVVQDMLKLSIAERDNPAGAEPINSESISSDTTLEGPRTSPFTHSHYNAGSTSNEPTTFANPALKSTTLPKVYQSVPPCVKTWSIMLHAFMRHNQPDAAEKILRIMRARGVEPDAVTWRNIIGGYAQMQMPEEVVDAVQRMEKDRFKPDDWTMKALSMVGDRDRLMQAFERAVRARAEDERGEQDGLKEDDDADSRAQETVVDDDTDEWE